MCPFFFLHIISSYLKILYSRHDSITAISRSSHMVGLSKNSSNLISRTNACMHAGEDIWEIRQIVIGNGTRVAKEVTTGMMMMRGLATMAVMELVAKTRVTMGPVTSQAMMMTRAAMTTGLMTMVTMMGPVA
jgi:hypothetical protein